MTTDRNGHVHGRDGRYAVKQQGEPGAAASLSAAAGEEHLVRLELEAADITWDQERPLADLVARAEGRTVVIGAEAIEGAEYSTAFGRADAEVSGPHRQHRAQRPLLDCIEIEPDPHSEPGTRAGFIATARLRLDNDQMQAVFSPDNRSDRSPSTHAMLVGDVLAHRYDAFEDSTSPAVLARHTAGFTYTASDRANFDLVVRRRVGPDAHVADVLDTFSDGRSEELAALLHSQGSAAGREAWDDLHRRANEEGHLIDHYRSRLLSVTREAEVENEAAYVAVRPARAWGDVDYGFYTADGEPLAIRTGPHPVIEGSAGRVPVRLLAQDPPSSIESHSPNEPPMVVFDVDALRTPYASHRRPAPTPV